MSNLGHAALLRRCELPPINESAELTQGALVNSLSTLRYTATFSLQKILQYIKGSVQREVRWVWAWGHFNVRVIPFIGCSPGDLDARCETAFRFHIFLTRCPLDRKRNHGPMGAALESSCYYVLYMVRILFLGSATTTRWGQLWRSLRWM